MQFLYYHKDTTYGSFHITNTNICDILAEIQPDDIIDGLDCVGIRVNRYFENNFFKREEIIGKLGSEVFPESMP